LTSSKKIININFSESVREILTKSQTEDNNNLIQRLWSKDPSLWMPDAGKDENIPELTDRLGWLDLPDTMSEDIKEIRNFAAEIKKREIERIVLLGMGGSSLAPEVLMSIFQNKHGYPPLTVLDSTNPKAIRAVQITIDPLKTLFIVASKSGSTIETISLYKYFYKLLDDMTDKAGDHFIAITDAGSNLEKIALENKFLRIFNAPTDIGGRYSALSHFGMVPAGLIGVDLEAIFKSAGAVSVNCKNTKSIIQNPAASLGYVMAELAKRGKDKLTFITSPSLCSFVHWLEQLIAESTGKNGKGIVPVVNEEIGDIELYGYDRSFVYLRLDEDDNTEFDTFAEKMEKKGYPLIKINWQDKTDIGAEFFRWEFAVAVAGAVMNINPFDQPDVESAKNRARRLMDDYSQNGKLPKEEPDITEGNLELITDEKIPGDTISEKIDSFLKKSVNGDYASIQAYLPCRDDIDKLLLKIQQRIREKTKLATTLGYGPRYLHSTGQMHKGDGNKGLFIQIVHEIKEDLEVPGESYTFGKLITAQAMGDYHALSDKNRRIIRIKIKDDLIEGLRKISSALD